jgi:hypothetical protein
MRKTNIRYVARGGYKARTNRKYTVSDIHRVVQAQGGMIVLLKDGRRAGVSFDQGRALQNAMQMA